MPLRITPTISALAAVVLLVSACASPVAVDYETKCAEYQQGIEDILDEWSEANPGNLMGAFAVLDELEAEADEMARDLGGPFAPEGWWLVEAGGGLC